MEITEGSRILLVPAAVFTPPFMGVLADLHSGTFGSFTNVYGPTQGCLQTWTGTSFGCSQKFKK